MTKYIYFHYMKELFFAEQKKMAKFAIYFYKK